MVNLQVRHVVVPQNGVVFLTGLPPDFVTILTSGQSEEAEYIARAHNIFVVDSGKVVIDTLPSSTLHLSKPITAKISFSDGEYVAEFAEAEIVTSGETRKEAIEWLRDTIVSLYEYYNNERAALGPLPRRQLTVMETYIGKEQSTEA